MANPNLPERALIGALLSDPRLLDEVPSLRVEDFGHPIFRAVFAAVADSHGALPESRDAGFAELIADRINHPAVDAAYVRALAASHTEPAEAASYGHLIQEAGLRRELASHADRIAELAGTQRGTDEGLDHLSKLSQALNRSALRMGTPDVVTEAAVRAGDPRIDREDLLLADLLQNHDILGFLEDWLSPEYFTVSRCREVYEAIVTVAQNGEPVNELTLVKELGRRHDQAEATGSRTEIGDRQDRPVVETDSAFLARLMTTVVIEGTAVEVGRDLLIENTRTELAALVAQGLKNDLGPTYDPRRSARSVRTASHDAPTRGPELLRPPPTPGLGPDGPRLGM